MKFRCKKPFTGGGTHYNVGDTVEIEEGHPRIAGLVQGNYIVYNPSLNTPQEEPAANEPEKIKSRRSGK